MATEKVTKQKDPKRQEASKRGYENKIDKIVEQRLAEMKKDIEKNQNSPSSGVSTPSNGVPTLSHSPDGVDHGPNTPSNGPSTTHVIGFLIIIGVAYFAYSRSSTTTTHAPVQTVKPAPARSQHTIDLSNF